MLALGARIRSGSRARATEPEFVSEAYRLAGQPKNLAVFSGEAGTKKVAAAEWLIK